MSTIDQILARMTSDDAVTAKTASAAAQAPAPSAADRMLSTVRDLSSKLASDQTPAAPAQGSAVDALQKIASDAAALEDQAMLHQSKLAGAVMCDGFIERLAQYDGAVGSATKTASAADMEKVAQDAYAKGVADTEKRAAEQFDAGYQAQINAVHKIASEIHVAGQQSARNVLSALSR